LSLADAGKINLKSPLRYYGRLADEPEKLPWGVGYDVELSGVDYGGSFVLASGGLRLGYIARTDHRAPLAVHAGDSITLLTQGRLPQMYRDEGAFDRRAYLSQQGVDLVGALRAPELSEVVKPGGARMFTWISRGRRRLRDEVDELLSKDANVLGVLRAMCLGSQFCRSGRGEGFPENRRVSRVGGCGVTRGRNRCGAVLGRVQAGVGARVDHGSHAAVVVSLCGRSRTKDTGATRRFAGGDCGGGRIFLPVAGVVEFGCDCGVITTGGEAVGVGRFKLSTFVSGDRRYWRLALPWMEVTVQPYAHALYGWRGVTKDVSYEPRGI